MSLIWNGLLLAWFVVLCLVPDPRPLGALLVQSFGRARLKVVVPAALLLAPLLAVLALWINYTFFPIAQQVWFGVVSAVLGVLPRIGQIAHDIGDSRHPATRLGMLKSKLKIPIPLGGAKRGRTIVS